MKIYNGKIKNLYVKSVEVNGDKINVLTDSVVLRENAPFYVNRFGRLVSFEHATFLPTFDEAESFVKGVIMNTPKAFDRATCLYACYGDMKEEEISKDQFKVLKKTYKNIRKEKRANDE